MIGLSFFHRKLWKLIQSIQLNRWIQLKYSSNYVFYAVQHCWLNNLSQLLKVKVKVTQLCLTLCDRGHGLYSPWNFPGQNTGVGSLSLLQGIFQTQDWTQVSHIAGGFFTIWAIREDLLSFSLYVINEKTFVQIFVLSESL